MSDGELKKRIENEIKKSMDTLKIDLEELEKRVIKTDVAFTFNYAFLDEAKKEFPETWFDPRGKTLIENYGEAILRLQDTVKYKLKWFGGNK